MGRSSQNYYQIHMMEVLVILPKPWGISWWSCNKDYGIEKIVLKELFSGFRLREKKKIIMNCSMKHVVIFHTHHAVANNITIKLRIFIVCWEQKTLVAYHITCPEKATATFRIDFLYNTPFSQTHWDPFLLEKLAKISSPVENYPPIIVPTDK